jgi:predicted ArsR family transcriptional regulator
MVDAPAPRPSVELFSDALPLSVKQREVLDVLQSFPHGARSAELAEKLGMHVNTARGHLDELVSRGAVRVSSTQAEGRGRPSLIFQVRVPDNRAVVNEYVALVEVLTSALADTGVLTPETLEQARQLGRDWARRMNEEGLTPATEEDVLEQLYIKLRDMGFDPMITPPVDESGGHGQLSLHSCPFVTEGRPRPSAFVCAIHEGFLQENTGSCPGTGTGPVSLTLLPYADGGACVVRVNKSEEAPQED